MTASNHGLHQDKCVLKINIYQLCGKTLLQASRQQGEQCEHCSARVNSVLDAQKTKTCQPRGSGETYLQLAGRANEDAPCSKHVLCSGELSPLLSSGRVGIVAHALVVLVRSGVGLKSASYC